MRTIKVSSVSEYIKELENIGIENYIFRGQNEPYFGIKANGFRNYLGGWTSYKIYNIDEISKDYYNRIVSKLTEEEKKYFLAFCQHHGVPTNLIDFSYSPLIALFFSCQGKQVPTFSIEELVGSATIDELKSDSCVQNRLINNLINKLEKPMLSKYAQVYLLDKKWLVDITDILLQVGKGNFLERIYSNGEIRKQLIYQIIQMFERSQASEEDIVECLTQMIECYKLNDFDYWGNLLLEESDEGESMGEELFSFPEKLKKEKLEETLHTLYDYVFHEMENENIPYECDIFDGYPYDGEIYQLAAAIYVMLLANLVRIFYEVKGGNERLILKLKIYFTYKPANLFDRINAQKGLFVYQPYLYSHDDIYNYNVLSIQEVAPDILIEVDNYNQILAELDSLGVNLDSVYGDLDNIAKSVVYSYRRKNGL